MCFSFYVRQIVADINALLQSSFPCHGMQFHDCLYLAVRIVDDYDAVDDGVNCRVWKGKRVHCAHVNWCLCVDCGYEVGELVVSPPAT